MIKFNHIIDYMIKLNQKISTQDIHQWHMIKFNHILLQVYIDFTPWNIWWNIWLNLIIWHQWSTNKTLNTPLIEIGTVHLANHIWAARTWPLCYTRSSPACLARCMRDIHFRWRRGAMQMSSYRSRSSLMHAAATSCCRCLSIIL